MDLVKQSVSAPESLQIGTPAADAPRTRKWLLTYRSVEPVAIVLDAVLIFLVSIATGVVYHLNTIGAPGDVMQYAAAGAVVLALFISRTKLHDLYHPTELLNFRGQVNRIALIWIGVILFLASVVFALKIGNEFSRGASLSFAIWGLVALAAARLFWRYFLAYGLSHSKFAGRNVVLITDHSFDHAKDLVALLARHGLLLKRHFALPDHEHDAQRAEVISQAISYMRGSDVEEIVVGGELDRWPQMGGLISSLRMLPLPVNFVPLGNTSDLYKLPSHTIGENLAIELQRGPLTTFERMIKRMFDIVLASTGLIVLLPLLLITAVLIKLDSPGPVLFRQRRCGFNGRVFQILKFRTMTVLEDGDVITQASRDDARVTRLGKWLRRTSIDELPQLANVLSGSMSIVGPRPHAMAHDNQFDKLVSNYARRHHVKPGLTGWAQVNGYRGQTPTVADMERRVKLDLAYIDNWSLGFDCRIVMKTVVELIRGHNAY